MLWVLSPQVEACIQILWHSTLGWKASVAENKEPFSCLYLTALSVVIWWATVQQIRTLKVMHGTCFPPDARFIFYRTEYTVISLRIKGHGLVVIHFSCSSLCPMCVNTNEGNYLLGLLFVRVKKQHNWPVEVGTTKYIISTGELAITAIGCSKWSPRLPLGRLNDILKYHISLI